MVEIRLNEITLGKRLLKILLNYIRSVFAINTALVTGVAGFIGSHLAEELLHRGYSVIGVDRFSDFYNRKIKEDNLANLKTNPKFKLIEEDLLNLDLKELNLDYVFHEAAQAGVRASWGKEFQVYVKDNILVTQKLLEDCLDSNIKKLVFASSSSIYGDVNELPIHEDILPKPVSPYGVTKLAAENLCYLYWKNYKIPTISLRYFTVYGPRQRPDMAINKFVNAIIKGKEIIIYGDGNQTRDFTYISDVINANVLAAESHLEGEALNIGGGSRISVNRLIDLLEDIIGKKAKRKHIGDQKGDVKNTMAGIEKSKRLLGYKPTVKIEDGLKRYVDWVSKIEENGI